MCRILFPPFSLFPYISLAHTFPLRRSSGQQAPFSSSLGDLHITNEITVAKAELIQPLPTTHPSRLSACLAISPDSCPPVTCKPRPEMGRGEGGEVDDKEQVKKKEERGQKSRKVGERNQHERRKSEEGVRQIKMGEELQVRAARKC